MYLADEVARLWELLPHPPGTYVRWFARRGDERVGGGVDDPRELLLAIRSMAGANFYVAPNPAKTRSGTRHRTADVSHWCYFLIDVDPIQELAFPEYVMSRALDLLSEWWEIDFNLRRPLIIDSGRGMQAWIRLGEIPVDPEICGAILPRVARITNGFWLRKLADTIGTMCGCRIDTTCMDLPRVMRCPGTLNLKTGRTASLIVPSAEVYDGLAVKMRDGVPSEQFKPTPIMTLPSGTPWQQVYVHLTIRAQDYLTKGQDEPGRHDTMFHAALTLAQKGLDRDEVRRAVQYGNERWDALHPQDVEAGRVMTLGPAEIEHALDTAFQRLQRDDEREMIDLGPVTTQEG